MKFLKISSCFFGIMILAFMFNSCTNNSKNGPIQEDAHIVNRESQSSVEAAHIILAHREEIKSDLSLCARALKPLLLDETFSRLVASECAKEELDGDFKVKLSDLATFYESAMQQTLFQKIQVQQAQNGLSNDELLQLSAILSDFNVEDIGLEIEINLGFLNNNGDFLNQNWDRRHCEFVAVGQFYEWTSMPAWLSSSDTHHNIDLDFAYTHPGWFVQVRTEKFKGLSLKEYEPFMGPVAKCWCYSCEYGGDICQKSANPGSPCSCKNSPCTGCVIPL